MRMTSLEYAALIARLHPHTTTESRTAKAREADIQDAIETHLKSYGHACYYYRARMDKPTTGRVGTPDFIGWIRGRPFMLEVKRPGGKLTQDQGGELRRGQLAGAPSVAVVHSVEEARQALEKLTSG